MPRLFVAVEVGEHARQALADALAVVQPLSPRSKWVRAEHLHLTLAFLGNMADEAVPALRAALDGAAALHAPHTLRLAGGGTFGPAGRPRVLWAGLDGELAALRALHNDVEEALLEHGYRPEARAFHPHVTLARAKDPRGDRTLAACAERLAELPALPVPVREVVLFQSHPGGALRYEVLGRAALALTPLRPL